MANFLGTALKFVGYLPLVLDVFTIVMKIVEAVKGIQRAKKTNQLNDLATYETVVEVQTKKILDKVHSILPANVKQRATLQETKNFADDARVFVGTLVNLIDSATKLFKD